MAPSTAMVRPGEILQTAVSRGDLARVRDLLRNGASATERGRHDTTALHWAAAANEAAIVAELLENGADPNARAADGCSALHYAAREDAAEAVSALLCGGADARLTNREGRTPLQEVYDENDEEGAAIARLLRDGEKTRDIVFVPSSFGPTSSRHHQSECASRDDDVDTHTSRTSRDGKSDTDSSVGVRGSRSVGASTAVRGDAGIRDSRRTTLGAFGPTNSAADDALERAMRDMAALLRGGASPAAPDRVTVSEKDAAAERDPNASALGTRDSRVDSGAGGESSNAGFKTLTARKYVPAAAHEPRPPRPRARRPCGCGSGRTGDWRTPSTPRSAPRTSLRRRLGVAGLGKPAPARRTSACPGRRSPRRTPGGGGLRRGDARVSRYSKYRMNTRRVSYVLICIYTISRAPRARAAAENDAETPRICGLVKSKHSVF